MATAADLHKLIKEGKTKLSSMLIEDRFVLDYEVEGDIQFGSIQFKSQVSIRARSKVIRFIDCKCDFLIIEGDAIELMVTDCEIKDIISLRRCQIERLHIHKTFIGNAIVISDIVIKSMYLQHLTTGENGSIVVGGDFGNVILEDIKGFQTIYLVGKNQEKWSNKSIPENTLTNFGLLSYKPGAGFYGRLEIINVKIINFKLSGPNNGTVYLENIIVTKVEFVVFSNNGTCIYSNILFNQASQDSGIILRHSNMGNAYLNNIDFSELKHIDIAYSNIRHILPSNVKWCNKIDLNIEDVIEKRILLRESYKQLKIVNINNHDKIEELRFHSLEMDAYRQQLKYEKGKSEDKFILYINRWSNNHGLSWGLPLLWMFGLTIFFYTTNKGLLGYTRFDESYFIKDIVSSLEFLNPLHKYTDVFPGQNEKSSSVQFTRLLDYIYRILIGYFLYQFLAAFRKFVKK